MAAAVSVIAAVTIGAGALPALASVTTTPPTEPTSTTFLDTSDNTYAPTLVRDQAGGAHILYVRSGAGVYAYCAPTANCADSTQWAKVTVATSVDSRSSRLVLTPDGKPRILFGSPFRYASCDTACTTPGGWTVIDLSSKFRGFDDVQGAHSFATDPQGRPRFAFTLSNPDDPLDYGLVYASCDAACTNVAGWNATVIRRTTTTTQEVTYYDFPSLVFDTLGRPRLATEVVEHMLFDPDVVYSAYLECNSTCTDEANWSFLPLNAIPAAPPVLRLDSAGVAHLAAYGNSLTHFACLGACAASAANWVGGPIGLPAGDGAKPDMGFDSQGRPVLVFDTNSGGLGLGMGLATCISACNSAGSVWQARRVDSGTSPTYAAVGHQGCGGTEQAWVIGDVPSLATGPNGSIWVAHAGYHGYTDCLNNTFIDLNSVFVDQLPTSGSGGGQKAPSDYNGDAKTDYGI